MDFLMLERPIPHSAWRNIGNMEVNMSSYKARGKYEKKNCFASPTILSSYIYMFLWIFLFLGTKILKKNTFLKCPPPAPLAGLTPVKSSIY